MKQPGGFGAVTAVTLTLHARTSDTILRTEQIVTHVSYPTILHDAQNEVGDRFLAVCTVLARSQR